MTDRFTLPPVDIDTVLAPYLGPPGVIMHPVDVTITDPSTVTGTRIQTIALSPEIIAAKDWQALLALLSSIVGAPVRKFEIRRAQRLDLSAA